MQERWHDRERVSVRGVRMMKRKTGGCVREGGRGHGEGSAARE